MKIIVGADPWGVALKNEIAQHLESIGHKVIDIGNTDNESEAYYNIAEKAARMIQQGEAERAVLCCGTGMGMAIVANKFKGIYASVVESVLAAKLCRAVNKANVLALGSLLMTPFVAVQAIDTWLATQHTETLEEHSEFLCKALIDIAAIEDKSFQ